VASVGAPLVAVRARGSQGRGAAVSRRRRRPLNCLAAQQAAEKAIKAVLVAADVDFPRTHDLERLLALLPRGTRLQAAELDLAGLSGWSVAGRYPGNLPDATFEDAEEAVAVAATIVELGLITAKRHRPRDHPLGLATLRW
jgi:HEPN domain-containing protein